MKHRPPIELRAACPLGRTGSGILFGHAYESDARYTVKAGEKHACCFTLYLCS